MRTSNSWKRLVLTALLSLWLLTGCASDDPFVSSRVSSPQERAALDAARLLAYRGDPAAGAAFASVTGQWPDSAEGWEARVDYARDTEEGALARDLAERLVLAPSAADRLVIQTLLARLETDLVVREARLYELLGESGGAAGWPRAALAEVFETRGNLQAAAAAYAQATEETPTLARAWLGLARTLQASGDQGVAAEAFQRYLDLRPNDPDALFALAFVLARQPRRAQDARTLLERADSVRPGDPDILTNLGSVNLLTEAPDPVAAQRCFESALTLTPNDPVLHYNLGVLHADHLNNKQEAIRHFQRYLELGGEDELRITAWIAELRK